MVLVTSHNIQQVEKVYPAAILKLRKRGLVAAALTFEQLHIDGGELKYNDGRKVRTATDEGWYPPLPFLKHRR